MSNVLEEFHIQVIIKNKSYGKGLHIPLILHDGHYYHDDGPIKFESYNQKSSDTKYIAYDFETVGGLPYMFSYATTDVQKTIYTKRPSKKFMTYVIEILNYY
jgi:hypothetical protein